MVQVANFSTRRNFMEVQVVILSTRRKFMEVSNGSTGCHFKHAAKFHGGDKLWYRLQF